MSEVINNNPYELFTALTNVLWALVAFISFILISKNSNNSNSKAKLWKAVFVMLFVSNILASLVHGLSIDIETSELIWIPINLILGLMIALLMSAALYDYLGKDTMQKYFPYLIGVAVIFFAMTQFNRDTFLIFIAYQSIYMLLILTMYIHLAIKKHVGAGVICVGMFLFILAAVAQAIGPYELALFIPINQDGLYHLIGIPSTILLTIGVIKNLKNRNIE
ncbi:DUF6962 family protein [Leucothrix arctica]|uniref:Histidine kinase N-terminal 7TM region domain-containing protein n=1 Tax=Leucothrix arctica TaxID=1481894 RepID=A0A317CDY0_9GAMM|nr:hypothetical protein [Leucothrix arctica]PWQ96748.1 hypothetical protein DKT75_08230 [Leucothrix arctica]